MADALGRRLREEIRLKNFKQRRRSVRALKIAAQADEVPSLAVDHGGVGCAFEEIDAIDDGSKRVTEVGAELGLGVGRVHLMIEAIQALPLFGGDFFADLTRVMRAIADKHAGGRLLSVLEGGYNLDGLAPAVRSHVEALE